MLPPPLWTSINIFILVIRPPVGLGIGIGNKKLLQTPDESKPAPHLGLKWKNALLNLSDVRFWHCARMCRCVFVYVEARRLSRRSVQWRGVISLLPGSKEENLVDPSAKPCVCLTGLSFQWKDVGSFKSHIWILFFSISAFNVSSFIITCSPPPVHAPWITIQMCLRSFIKRIKPTPIWGSLWLTFNKNIFSFHAHSCCDALKRCQIPLQSCQFTYCTFKTGAYAHKMEAVVICNGILRLLVLKKASSERWFGACI